MELFIRPCKCPCTNIDYNILYKTDRVHYAHIVSQSNQVLRQKERTKVNCFIWTVRPQTIWHPNSFLNIEYNCSPCWQKWTLYWPPVSIVQVNSSGPSVGTDDLKLMKREWSPAVSSPSGGCSQGTGPGEAPVAWILAGSILEVLLFYWTTRLTPWWPQIGPWPEESHLINAAMHTLTQGKAGAAYLLVETQTTERHRGSISCKVTSATI